MGLMSTQPVDGAPAARRTRQGGAVDAVLRAADGFRTAQDLHAELRHRGQPVGLTTVYRHLKMLVEAGTVDVVHGPDGEAQYRLCSGGERSRSDHHHHLVCRVCGSAVEVDGPDVEAWTESVAAANGYTDVSHTLEIFGRCPAHAR
jgi:Fur family ferric uptake transcriptional regulator